MLMCTERCHYYQTFKTFDRGKTYEKYKQCTRCGHIVEKEEFPDPYCYCCNARYRHRYPKSMITRRIARERKRERQLKEQNQKQHLLITMVKN